MATNGNETMAMWTVPQVARDLGVNRQKILSWIASGELIAVNIARQADGKRGRYRVTAAALADFLQSRQTRPPAKPMRRRRRVEAPAGPY